MVLRLINGTGQRVTGPLDMFGVMTGLTAMNSMLFMLLLATRVPVIDRVLGRVKAVRWHQLLGRVTVLGVLTHAVLTLTGTGWTNRDDLTSTIGPLWAGNLSPVFTSAALLLLATIASVLAVYRGLRREIWYLLNILSCAAVLLAIPYMLRFGSVFLPSKAQRIYWGVLSTPVGVYLLWHRVLSPFLRPWKHRLKLVSTVHLTPDLPRLEFSGRHLGKLETRDGQYFIRHLLAPQLWTWAHRFFLSVAPTRDRLCITIRVTDEHTAELTAARPGTRIIFTGPYGAFTDTSRTRNDLVLIGAGIGPAPIRLLLEVIMVYPVDTVMILRASGPENLVLLDELRELCDNRGITLHLMIGPCYEGHWVGLGYAGRNFATLAPDLENSDVFVCGLGGLVGSVLVGARGLGVSPEQCHEERLTL